MKVYVHVINGNYYYLNKKPLSGKREGTLVFNHMSKNLLSDMHDLRRLLEEGTPKEAKELLLNLENFVPYEF